MSIYVCVCIYTYTDTYYTIIFKSSVWALSLTLAEPYF